MSGYHLCVIYLDRNATTPILPKVLEAMMPYLTTEWGNPSSSYRFGSKLKGVVEMAREQVAELIGAHPGEVIFTSCATESNNATIHAALQATGKRHVITSVVEHSSVLNHVSSLVGTDRRAACDSETSTARPAVAPYRVTYLPIDRDGLLKVADLENAISDDTAVVSLMWANCTRSRPLGSACGCPLRALRLAVPSGSASETGVLFPVKEVAEMCRARGVLFHCDAREERILHLIPNTELNGHKTQRLANTTNITFHGIESEALLILLDQAGICASSDSACLADSAEPSHVVKAMKPESTASRHMIRFSLDVANTATDIKKVLSEVTGAVKMLRS